ncbi:MAG: YhfT family protein [Clostridia bacterium]
MEFLKYVVIAAIGALAAIMANKGIAVFNDGFRPVYPEYFAGKMDRKALAATSFAISFGLVIGFGIPTSIGATIMLAHCVLLATDIIGTWCPNTKLGTIIAGSIGAAWGVLLLVGLDFLVKLFGYLPFNFLANGSLGKVSDPIVIAFAIFPAVAVGFQGGLKKALITAVSTMATFILINFLNAKKFIVIFGNTLNLNAAGMAMLVGVIMMIVFAARKKKEVVEGETQAPSMSTIFKDNVTRIKKNWIWFVASGALISASSCLGIMAGDPTSLKLMAAGEITSAAMVAFVRAIGFIPLVVTTAIVTGVYTPAGITFTWAIGMVSALIPNPIIAVIVAAVGGGAMLFLEVQSLSLLANVLDKYEGLRDMGGHIRNAMNQVLEVALLIGGVLACQAMMPGFGFMFVIGLWLINKCGKKPVIVPLAVGPVAAIILGLLVNILMLIGIM